MLGINGGEFLLLIVVALVVVGPERLPRYAEQLGVWARTARSYAQTAKSRVSEELGEDVADVDWAALDPRRYDPRRIVREALMDDTPPSAVKRGPAPGPAPGPARGSSAASTAPSQGSAARSGPPAAGASPTPGPGAETAAAPEPTPWDDEAT